MRPRKYFPKVNEMAYEVPELWSYDAGSTILPLFYGCHLFDGTIPSEFDEESQPIKYHYDLDFEYADLKKAYIEWYGERRIGKALPPVDSYAYSVHDSSTMARSLIATDAEAYDYCGAWLSDQIQLFIKANTDKYLKLVDTIGFKYDPISNYDMTETKDTTIGEESVSHVVDKNGKQLTFMSNQVDLTAPTEGDMDGADAHISDWNSADKDSVSTTINNPNEVKHYTTTYDDDSDDRLEWREVQGIANAKTSQDTELAAKAQETLYNGENYTDTRSKDNDSYELKRSGNIGVTTSQQMIESEREVARFNLLKEFFEDLNRYLLLATWD